MGESVRIQDLARRMIRLSGFSVRDEKHPGGDIEIELGGLRPSDKLDEELAIGDGVEGSQHPKIMKRMSNICPWLF
jgi:FlaA1/EpsC-like NDP-sugar epimerase